MTAKIIKLPEVLNSEVSDSVHSLFVPALASPGFVSIDASSVDRLTTSCAQLLASFLQTRKSSKKDTKITEYSEAFRAAWNDFGLATLFPLAEENSGA